MKRKFDQSIFDDPQCPKNAVYATIDSMGNVMAYTTTQPPMREGDAIVWVWGLPGF